MLKNDSMVKYITDRAPALAPFNYFRSTPAAPAAPVLRAIA